MCNFLQPPVTSSLLSSYIPLNTPFSNTLNLCPSFKGRYWVPFHVLWSKEPVYNAPLFTMEKNPGFMIKVWHNPKLLFQFLKWPLLMYPNRNQNVRWNIGVLSWHGLYILNLCTFLKPVVQNLNISDLPYNTWYIMNNSQHLKIKFLNHSQENV
jgi:hypothetical protein